ncbi:MAG: Tm-1-like ATP-binding domain-containing protein [Deltaproteobacteria bacterium]|nr:Tm-1-like ATP-binding domain-containing protein [Deltaproteobacteria bacterium]
MAKSIAVIGTCDTRGEEIGYIADIIAGRGHRPVVVDVGILGEGDFRPTVDKDRVADAADVTIEGLIKLESESEAMKKMAEGASKIINGLYSGNRLDGVLALGGTMGTSLALTVMMSLPIRLPKLILSTIAFSPLIPPDAIIGDLQMMGWVAGLRGINSINRQVLSSAAGAIIGAAESFDKANMEKARTVVGLTSMGTTPCRYAVEWLEPGLKERGYDVAVFHASGMGGRMFEQCISQGVIDAALDLELAEMANEVAGGMTNGGAHRLESAGRRGIPQIVAPTVDGIWWSPGRPVPDRFQGRPMREHNWLVCNAPTSEKEKIAAAELIAEKLNKGTGPTAVVIALEGRGGREHSGFDKIMEWKAVSEVLKNKLKPEVKLIELNASLNDRAFSETVLALLDEMMPASGVQ